ncbi:ribosomal protein S18-alanine N-acetyltransferase [Pectinatus frisingensis]|jgi:ribosomal-protein-alanine N-acetyltransferase|uniref:ribosomal protein S18-alanine N-acetyltransferase n=1 Tax=Pectinatus frisingensis TaxID=865 RepID=UPI0015F6D3D4|nr:ribosomal protein S18-alanine N-acetyltransferase [Pectinatus frisingensis]
MKVEYRKMLPSDAAAVEVVEKSCFSMPWSRQSFWEEAVKKDAYYLLAVDCSTDIEVVIGYVGVWLIFGEGHITNVALMPHYQGRGIASAMIKKIIMIIRSMGINSMTLEVRPSNNKALRLYQKFGFKSVGRRPHYYLDNNEDAEIMWLIFK